MIGRAFDLFDLTGRVALVTGGSKGLGKAMATGLAQAGADVISVSRTIEELNQAKNEIEAALWRWRTHLDLVYVRGDLVLIDEAVGMEV